MFLSMQTAQTIRFLCRGRHSFIDGQNTSLIVSSFYCIAIIYIHLFVLSVFLFGLPLLFIFHSRPEVLDILSYHTHFLISIPPLVGIGDPVKVNMSSNIPKIVFDFICNSVLVSLYILPRSLIFLCVVLQLLQHEEFLKSRLMDRNLQWLCYLSTTSVYGNCGGAWLDEDYPISPTSELVKARLAAEEGWLNIGHDLGLSAHVFRPGGIYGPGRSAVDTIIKQEPLSEIQKIRASRRYTSRVHVADICQALEASIYKPSPGKTYNIVDDDPAPRIEIFTFARELIEKKWPGQMKQTTSPDREESFIPEGSSRGKKRVSNARMKRELGVRLLHPSYRSGLQSIIEHMDNPFLHST
ncbi:hypothetical protein F0562_036034 [Nyssa sinensis]|uniref:NAD-dependent epimerase/dehydratase domain-containing protein n=1 Tax=Nyssa sinensis TaxID=561372 RepID=A0A5J5AEM9_9ASTE|nr:hypothetical protein F0562_036034 [Nyssa sinensis]